MKTVETIPSATIALFPNREAMHAYLAPLPLTRHVCDVPGVRSLPGEVRALLATYPDAESMNASMANAALVDMQAHASYLKYYANRAKL